MVRSSVGVSATRQSRGYANAKNRALGGMPAFILASPTSVIRLSGASLPRMVSAVSPGRLRRLSSEMAASSPTTL